jgi:hypothetical protein
VSQNKTLGQVLFEERYQYDAFWGKLDAASREFWEQVSAAVIAHHEATQWQPIATSPRDQEIVIWVKWAEGPSPVVAMKSTETDYDVWHIAGFARAISADIVTHWRPLPAPPKDYANG